MKLKLIVAIIFFILSILAVSSVFIWKDYALLIKIQLPMIIIFGYLWTSFGISYFFDRIISKAMKTGMQNENPYVLLIRLSPIINIFIFVFFGILALATVLTLTLSDI
ncbi:hypothetical protein MKS83_18655 [Chryseobacterium sp. Y16C]|uniref:hypothetical protein n=1 Tax=Chryseobacterium sp. Y16C TaxID=2920939 RepID=UPI001F0A1CA0|nr:hypothetical protein [Chryseobacterium sp. Y16C]UMQ41397.1 hypothetical protein MKS83_18655 [Chryseobacterium sp. Y16C]